MMNDIPFKLKRRKTVCENSVFNIHFDHLVDSESSLTRDYLVVEPKIKNSNGVTGVAILPIKDNKFGLVKVYRHPVDEFGWEIPRGFIDENESAEDAAVRELKEETGLFCDKKSLTSLGTITPEPGIISAQVNLYKANIIKNEQFERESELGHICFGWFSSEEIDNLILKQEIKDSSSLITLLKANQF